MKIDLPKRFNDGMWMVIKDNEPQYQFVVSSDCREINKLINLSFNDQDFYVLPPISFNPDEWNMRYIPEGQCTIDDNCFPRRDNLTIVVTGKSTLYLNYSSFGNTKTVSLILPKEMSLFKIFFLENCYERKSWFLIADKNFETKNVKDIYVRNNYVSEEVDFAGVGKKRILVDKRYVYDNGEIKKTGLTNEKRDEKIKSAEKRIKGFLRYPDVEYCLEQVYK